MKTIQKIFTILLLATIVSACGGDDDNNPPQTNNNEATINGTTYQIKSASLGLDAGPSYNNQFSLIFTDGLINVNALNAPTVETNTTTMGIGLFVDLGSTPLSTEQAVVNNITTSTYNLSDDTGVINNVVNFTDTYMLNGIQYGEFDDAGVTSFEVNNLGSGIITIHSFLVDLTARTGSVDCDFSFTDDTGKLVSGNYSGSLKIHDDR